MKSELSIPATPIFFKVNFLYSVAALNKKNFSAFQFPEVFEMACIFSIFSFDSDVVFVDQLSNYQTSHAQTKQLPEYFIFDGTIRDAHQGDATLSSVLSPEPDIVTLDDNSNDPKNPYGFGIQQLIVPRSLIYLNLPPNPFNTLATMEVVTPNPTQHDGNYSPQSPPPSEPSPISTPPLNLSTIDGWETPHTTTDDNTLFSEDKQRRVHWNSPMNETYHSEVESRRIYLLPSRCPPSPPCQMNWKSEMRMSFPKKGVLQHVCEGCEQMISRQKSLQERLLKTEFLQTLKLYIY